MALVEQPWVWAWLFRGVCARLPHGFQTALDRNMRAGAHGQGRGPLVSTNVPRAPNYVSIALIPDAAAPRRHEPLHVLQSERAGQREQRSSGTATRGSGRARRGRTPRGSGRARRGSARRGSARRSQLPRPRSSALRVLEFPVVLGAEMHTAGAGTKQKQMEHMWMATE